MLDVPVNDLLFVDVLKAYSDLRKNVQCVILSKIILPLSHHVFTQVLPSFIFSDDVVSLVNLEVICDTKHMVARLASYLSIDL